MRKLHRHFSHPHALEPFESSKKDDDVDVVVDDLDDESIIIDCSGCEQQLSSPAFSCPKADCDFHLHKSCLELPRSLDHKSHPDHTLTLLSEPPEYTYYDCNACGDRIKGFSFRCEQSCDFRLHAKCAVLPDTVDCKAHDHHRALVVRHCTPKAGESIFDMTTLCDVCDGSVVEGYWSYCCEECDFVTHLECVFAAEVARPTPVEEEEVEEEKEEEMEEEEDEDEEGISDEMRLHRANIKAMNRMALLKFQMQMTEMNARAVANLFRVY